MGDSLPEPSFNKFIKSRVLEFHREASDEVIKELSTTASQIVSLARNDRAIIFRVLIYNENSLECRFWIYSDKLLYACTNDKLFEDYLKIYLEILEATNLVATYDVERVRSLGIQINARSKDINIIILIIKYILNLEEKESVEGEAPLVKQKARTQSRQAEISGIKPSDAFEECIRRISNACGPGECPEEPEELLDGYGVVAAGFGTRYVCVMYNVGECRYAILNVSDDYAKLECVESKDVALEALRDILKEGGKLVRLGGM